MDDAQRLAQLINDLQALSLELHAEGEREGAGWASDCCDEHAAKATGRDERAGEVADSLDRLISGALRA